MIGNTGIQLAVASMLLQRYGFQKILPFVKDVPVPDPTTPFTDSDWDKVSQFLEDPRLPLLFQGLVTHSVVSEGYFQDSEPLVRYRQHILQLLQQHCADFPVTKTGVTLGECMDTPPPPALALAPLDVVVHIRLGDYRLADLVQDPAPQLAILREIRRKEPDTRIILVCAKPTTPAERNYLLLFEEFHPVLQHGTELEDFATLRAAERLVVTNSTFSWFAAYLGAARERWIPEPTFNTLGAIAPTDTMYTATTGYDLGLLDIPPGPEILPVTGEFLQGLMEWSIGDESIQTEYAEKVYYAIPKEKYLWVEEGIPESVIQTTQCLYIHSMQKIATKVFSYRWPNLRLILFHNSDYSIFHHCFREFLDAHPHVYIWTLNNLEVHPRVRTVPIFEQNRRWRGGTPDYDPPSTISRNPNRSIGIWVSSTWVTNPIREIWNTAFSQMRDRSGLFLSYRMNREEYREMMQDSIVSICPPGNGADTHRHWESLLSGAYAVVHNNAHTKNLLREYPSLPLIPIEDPEEVRQLELPTEVPCPFHPMLLREFWRILVRSHCAPMSDR